MTKLVFISESGEEILVDAPAGDTVMRAALSNDVDGIVGECGGSMMCATCHCYVDDAWIDRIGPRVDGEDEMLESAACEVRPTSRLSCQITIRPEMDGLIIHLPESQT